MEKEKKEEKETETEDANGKVEGDEREGAATEEENDEDESLERLQGKLNDAYGGQDDLNGKDLRAVADLETLRKRSIRDREDAAQRMRAQVIGDLLPALDAFQLGFAEAEKHEEATKFVEGFSMAVSLMETTLSEFGLAIIDPQGEGFDAKYHEAIGYEDHPDFDEGSVIRTIRTGYRIGEQLLRPATVILAKESGGSDEKSGEE